MKQKGTILLSITILALTTYIVFAQRLPQKTKLINKWEYKALDCTTPLDSINKLGREGWEMATVASSSSQCLIYFKRPE